MKKKSVMKLVCGDKEYPCRVTMGAMVRFKDETGRDISEMKQGNVYDMVCFLWCCVVSACCADGIGFEMDMREFADHVDPVMLGEWYGAMNGDIEKKMAVMTVNP